MVSYRYVVCPPEFSHVNLRAAVAMPLMLQPITATASAHARRIAQLARDKAVSELVQASCDVDMMSAPASPSRQLGDHIVNMSDVTNCSRTILLYKIAVHECSLLSGFS